MSRIFVTGSADGLGKMAAQLLIDQGHQVVLHARNKERAQDALARLRGFEGFVSRKSLKIRTGVQKVFTTKPWVASPEKLRSQVSGGSDSWRWLIG